jgi:uncharacterized membrane protein YdbT with pleckstrin-like domain
VGYIERSLGQSETLVYQANFHRLYHAAAWAVVFVMAVCVIGTVYSFYAQSYVYGSSMLISIGAMAFILTKFIPIWTTEIGVTSQRLIVKRGWLSLSTDELQLRAIEQVNVNQGIIGKILGFGRVDVHGTGKDCVKLPSIAEPLELVKKLEDAASKVKTKPAVA